MTTIPGDDLQLPETDLLQSIGKWIALFELEQKKRIKLAEAYFELKAELDALKHQKEDVIQGMP